MLFDVKFFKTLRLLGIITKRFFRGERIGHRKSPNRGASAEFAEYREYLPGDDLRFLDWNLYGRLRKLYIKKFHNEEDLTVSILVDSSQSMAFGTPGKFDQARRMAAAIAYIALQNQDLVRIYPFRQDLALEQESGFRPSHIHRIMGFLEKAGCEGQTASFEDVINRFLRKNRRPGVVFVLTDGMFGEELYRGLNRLAYGRFEVTLVQILSPEELNPDLAGLVELIDAEDRSRTSLRVTRQALTAYGEVLTELMDELKGYLRQKGMHYHRLVSDSPFEPALLQLFEVPGGRA